MYISAFKKIGLYIDRLLANNAIERKIFFDWLAPLLLCIHSFVSGVE